MNNRIALWLLAPFFLAAVSLAEAQQAGKVPRIGFLDAGTASGSAGLVDAFPQELSKLGCMEGKNIAIEYRLPSIRMSACLSLQATWFVLRLN